MPLCLNCELAFRPDHKGQQYCGERCRSQARERRKSAAKKRRRLADGGFDRSGGYVYLIQEGESGPIKIGWAKNPLERMRDHQCGNSIELRLIGAFPGGIADEYELHRRFSANRIRGEWFNPVPEMFDLLELSLQGLSPFV